MTSIISDDATKLIASILGKCGQCAKGNVPINDMHEVGYHMLKPCEAVPERARLKKMIELTKRLTVA